MEEDIVFSGKPTDIFKQGAAEMLTLLLLKESDCHGYDLTQRLRERSDGLLTVQEGSLYPVLRRLARDEMISAEEIFVKAKNGGTRIRIMYHIEQRGLDRLQELKEEYEIFLAGIERVFQNEGEQHDEK